MSSLTTGVIALFDQPEFETRLTILQVLHLVPCSKKVDKGNQNWKLILTDGEFICYAYVKYPASLLIEYGIVKKFSIVSLDMYYLDSMVPVYDSQIPFITVRDMHLECDTDKPESCAAYFAKWIDRSAMKQRKKERIG